MISNGTLKEPAGPATYSQGAAGAAGGSHSTRAHVTDGNYNANSTRAAAESAILANSCADASIAIFGRGSTPFSVSEESEESENDIRSRAAGATAVGGYKYAWPIGRLVGQHTQTQKRPEPLGVRD